MSELQLHETTVTVDIGGEEIAFTTGKLARQAHGAVTVRSGATVVLATAVGRSEAREGTDFFPLTVDIEEKMYAAGKIPGGFFKREGKASEKATLNARMVDRPIRPLWPKGFRNEVQIIGTVLSIDGEHSHDTLAINGASAALTISPLPFFGPVGAVRIGRIDGQIVVNPLMTQMEESDLDLIVCGTMDAITMVEAGAKRGVRGRHAAGVRRRARGDQDALPGAARPARQGRPAQVAGRRACSPRSTPATRRASTRCWPSTASPASRWPRPRPPRPSSAGVTGNATEADMVRRVQVRAAIAAIGEKRRSAAVKPAVDAQFREALRELSDAEQDSKELKSAKRAALYARIETELQLPFPSRVDGRLDSLARSYARSGGRLGLQADRAREDRDREAPARRARGRRDPPDRDRGRRSRPRTHGSGLFTRGQTQALTLVTLGTAKEEQRIDDLSLDTKKRYIHHYNFPPFSVGETGFMRGPKRRDIGHGALAERALVPVIPDAETFPYTMRVVSEILESNGSSSMASVCGSTMALMDAGVPITSPVAGIAMGLIKEGDELHRADRHPGRRGSPRRHGLQGRGHEGRHHRPADGHQDHGRHRRPAAAGAGAGARGPAVDPREHGEGHLRAAHASSRRTHRRSSPSRSTPTRSGSSSARAARRSAASRRSSTARSTSRRTASSASTPRARRWARAAAQRIEEMTRPIGVGTVYRERKVVKTAEFGAFVELRKGTDGLLHASRISPGVRVDSVDQVLTRGDVVTVEVTEVDTERGRVGLKLVSKTENGAEITAEAIGVRYKEQFPNAGQGGGQRPPRDGDRSRRRPRAAASGPAPRRRSRPLRVAN